jgi:hypothetical protein
VVSPLLRLLQPSAPPFLEFTGALMNYFTVARIRQRLGYFMEALRQMIKIDEAWHPTQPFSEVLRVCVGRTIQ